MHLNTQHPDFDEALEMLCLLPLDGRGAKLKELAGDLGHTNQSRLRELAKRLETQHGIRVEIAYSIAQSGAEMTIVAAWRANAGRLARGYWATVYAPNETPETPEAQHNDGGEGQRHNPQAVTAAG